MSDGFKGWGSILLIIGLVVAVSGFYFGLETNIIGGISGALVGISFFINAAFCKILEDTRDTLNRIEKILENQTKTEE